MIENIDVWLRSCQNRLSALSETESIAARKAGEVARLENRFAEA